MQVAKIPVTICDKIERWCRQFLWGSVNDNHKLNLVPWNSLCRPKPCGGAGVKLMREMNDALLMKLGWELLSCQNKLWVQVLADKYKLNPSSFPNSIKCNGSSTLWRAIANVWPMLIQNLRWSLGNGT